MNLSHLKLALQHPLTPIKVILGKPVPLYAQIYLTHRCNLKCEKCKVREKKAEELPAEEWKKIMDKMKSWGTSVVGIQGGEILLKEDYLEVLTYASKLFSTTIVSNATLMTPEKIDKIIKTGVNHLQFSFDSMSSIKEAKMGRGSITTQKVIETLEYLKSLDKKPKVTIISVLSSQNAHEIGEMIDFIDSMGANFSIAILESDDSRDWWFRGYAPELEFDKDTYKLAEKAIETIRRKQKEGKKVTTTSEYLDGAMDYIKNKTKTFCDAGKLYYSVDSDGKLMACQDMPPSNMRVDEMKSFKDAWKDAETVKAVKTCPGCYYGCYWTVSRLGNKPLNYLKGELKH